MRDFYLAVALANIRRCRDEFTHTAAAPDGLQNCATLTAANWPLNRPTTARRPRSNLSSLRAEPVLIATLLTGPRTNLRSITACGQYQSMIVFIPNPRSITRLTTSVIWNAMIATKPSNLNFHPMCSCLKSRCAASVMWAKRVTARAEKWPKAPCPPPA